MRTSNFTLNSFTGSGDITTKPGHILSIAGVPDIEYLTAKSIGLVASKKETPQRTKALSAAAASKVYERELTQYDRSTEQLRFYNVYYLSTVADTDTTIGANIKAIIDGYVAYGTLDEKIKYGGGVQYFISKKPRQSIGFSYKNDLTIWVTVSKNSLSGCFF